MRAVPFATYDRLVGAIYEASVDPRKWGDFLSLLSRSFGAARVSLHCHDQINRLNLGALHSGYDPAFIDVYRRHYAAVSPWAKAQSLGPIGKVQTPDLLVDRDTLRKTAFYNDWIRPQEDIGTGAGITIFRNPKLFLRLSCNIRYRDEEKYQDRLLACMNLIAPHIERAFRIGRQLRGREPTNKLVALFEKLPTAIFLLGAGGHVYYANQAAEHLRRDEELLAFDRTGRLVFVDPAANLALSDALFCIASRDHSRLAGEFTARGGQEDAAMTATIAPFRTTPDGEADIFDGLDQARPIAIAAVQVSAPRRVPDPADLTRLYGLTRAEAALAIQLYRGSSLKTHAVERGVSIHTARKQLSAVFEKTGCSQQSQLVALLARS